MSKTRFIFHVSIALFAVFALTIQSSGIARAATNQPQRPASPNINLDSEIRVLDGFVDDWLKLHKQQILLSKKASITNTEFTAFKSSSEGLKNRCSQFQTAIRDVIKKLKDSGHWNSLDDEVLARTNIERFKSKLRDGGGAKRVLEDASSQFCSQAESEITDPIERLRPKLSAQVQDLPFDLSAQPFELLMVRASYQPATPAFGNFLRCSGAIIRVLARMAVGKDILEGQAIKNFDCFCEQQCGTASTT